MKIKIIVVASILFNTSIGAMDSRCADNICSYFYRAINDLQYEKVELLLQYYGKNLIRDCKAWTGRVGKKGPLYIAARYGYPSVVRMLLKWDNNLCYEASIFEIFEAAIHGGCCVWELLPEYHKNRKAVQNQQHERGSRFSYEEEALWAIKGCSLESQVKVFKQLQEQEKEFERIRSERIQLICFMQLSKEKKYADINYLLSVKRY